MPIKTIALAIAGTPVAIPTAKYAIYLAKVLHARLVALYVVDESSVNDLLRNRIFVEVEAREYERELKDQGSVILERVGRMAESKGVAFESKLLSGIVHRRIVDTVRECGADILVMGRIKEIKSMKEVFYDEGERIFRESPCAVAVVQSAEAAEALYKEI
jgi:nucleotide-binding universal stress UspA family protein